MTVFLKKRWLLIIVLIAFIISQAPHLHYPFFWDESWVYALGVMLMYLHGPSLLPNAIDLSFSRGHPLFFHNVFAIWMDIFGPSHFSMHCCALFISILLLIAVYEILLKLFGQRAAAIGIVFVAVNQTFSVPACFVLPDVMIALFVLCSIYFYATEKFFWATLFLAMLFFTKESGLVVGVVLGFDAFLSLFTPGKSSQIRLYKCLSVLVPLFLIALFFILQKKMIGWYLNPEHTGLINLNYGHSLDMMRTCLRYIFINENKYLFFIFVVLLSVIPAIRQRRIRYLSLFIPAASLYALSLDFSYSELVCTLLFALFFASSGWAISQLKKFDYYNGHKQQLFVALSAIYLVAYLYFSSINFYEGRYLLPATIILLVLATLFCDFFLSHVAAQFFYAAVAAIALIGFYCIWQDTGDADSGAFDGMDIQQRIVDYFERNNLYNKMVMTGSYQDVIHLQNPFSGFRHTENKFTNVVFGKYDKRAAYVIIDGLELDSWYGEIKNDTDFHLVYRTEIGKKWAEIYARKH